MTEEASTASTNLPAEPRPPATMPPGSFRRVLNWFWRGRELRELRQARLPQLAMTLKQRAELALELGRRAQYPSEPLPQPGDAMALELYRQAAYWAIRSLAASGGTPADAEPWSTLDQASAVRIAGSAETLPRLLELAEQPAAVRAWELPKEQRSHDAALLRGAAEQLLADLEWTSRARDALWLQRAWRVGLVLFGIVLILAGLRFGLDHKEKSRNLAFGKPWRASSLIAGFGCRTPQQDCAESPDFFFHTNEEPNPWVEIDLGSRIDFTAVRVVNRRDCCFERAVPLVVEVSDDQQNYREVARRGSVFSSWLATFAPKQARFVRVRVAGRAHLHLAEVRVLR